MKWLIMPLSLGQRLGPYEILAPIGAGGMGEVYRAHDRNLNRDVAIKILATKLTGDDRAERRLLREAQSAAALDHPNICTIYEIGDVGGHFFIVMQYVDGQTVADRLASRPESRITGLPIEEALTIAEQVADALAEAHHHGIIHRDIKPQNIMLASSGRAKVLDFGLAILAAPLAPDAATRSVVTVPGAIAGTVRYMSPEQIRGEDLDARTDIFSLGTLLHELLTGGHPFAEPSVGETISAILTRDPMAIPDTVPLDLRHVVVKCLEKDKTKRYQSAREVADQLVRIRKRLEAVPEGVTVGAPLASPPMLAGAIGSSAFVGRENELRLMTAAWQFSKDGQRSVLFIAGEPGIGKTRLCAEFAHRCAEEGATVLIGRSDQQALVPYQPFIEALSWYARMCPQADLLSHLSAIGGGAELGLLLPELIRRVPTLPAVAPMNAEGQRFRLFETVSALLTAMSATHPTLVVFDDLHWADQPSLLMLRHIARSSGAARLCILANYRDSEVTGRHLLAQMLADLRRESFVTRVALAGLTEPQVAQLVGALADGAPRHLVQAVAENSGGNPLFIGEMLRHLTETGALAVLRDTAKMPELGIPEAVKDVIRQRLSRLSEDCNQVLTLAAVIGQEFDLALVEALGGLTEDRLLDVVDEAVNAQLVGEADGGRDRCRFVHALIRETLYDGLSGPRRARMHRRIGEAIERLTTHDPPLSDLAYHFTEASAIGAFDKAVEYATRAGDRATASLAHEEAARFYDMALRSLDCAPAGPASAAKRLDVYTRRGRAFAGIGQWLPAKEEFERAMRFVDGDAIGRRCELILGIAEASFWLGYEVAAVQRLASEALALAEQLPDGADLVANAMSCSARCHIVSGDIEGAVSLNLGAIALAGRHRTLAYPFGTLALYLAGRSAEAVALGREGASLARSIQDTYFTMYTLPHFAISLAAVGLYGNAQRVFEEAREFGRKYGAVGPLARVISFAAGFHLSVFDFPGAEELQREARELAARAGHAQPFISSGLDMLLTFARTGNPGPAEALLVDTATAAATHPWHRGLWAVRLSQARAELALARGDRYTAIEEATTAAEQGRAIGRPKYEVLALIARARALGGLQRTREALADARRATALARGTEDPALLLQALDVFLLLEGNDESLAEARALVDRIIGALPDETMRHRFHESETVQRVRPS